MRALLLAWATEQEANMTAAAPPTSAATVTAAADVSAWPEEWGTAGTPAGDSPFKIVLADVLPNSWVGSAQRRRQLSSPTPTDFLKTTFAALGHDQLSGFSEFEKHHDFTVWRVQVPDFDQNADFDGSYTRVPVANLFNNHLTVGQIMMLHSILAYMVCLLL